MIPTIQPLNGVPPELRRVFDDLLRVLNDRFAGVPASKVNSAISIEDGGGQVKITASVTIDTDAKPGDSQLKLRANLGGALELLSYAAGNQQILFDCSWEGGRLIAKDTTTCRIVKSDDLVHVWCAEGQVPGTNLTGEVLAMTVELKTAVGTSQIACAGFGGNLHPNHPVDVTGDANVSAAYRVGGLQVVAGRQAGVAFPTGGVTVDSQARTAISQLISRLSWVAGGHGLID